MKKIFATILLAFAAVSLSGQALMRTDFSDVGDSTYYVKADTTGVTAGPDGAGQSWDYSTATQTGAVSVWFRDPANTTNGASFPNATLAFTSSQGAYQYFSMSGDTMKIEGERSIANTVCTYTVLGNWINFPMNLGDTLWGTVSGSYPDGFISSVARNGMMMTTYDAAGSLVTPTMTYPSVKRIYRSIVLRDSSLTGAANSDDLTKVWEWYADGEPNPVMRIWWNSVAINGGAAQVAKEVWYASSFPTATQDPNAPQQVTLSPNPTNGQVKVSYELPTSNSVAITLFSANGQKVKEMSLDTQTPGFYEQTLQLEGLEAGFYLVKLQAGKAVVSRSLIVQ